MVVLVRMERLLMPFHKMEAPRRASSKIVDVHVMCYHCCLKATRDCRDTSICCSLFNGPLFDFVLQLWPSCFVPLETLLGLLYLMHVIFLLPPLLHHWYINVELSRSCSIPMFYCMTNSLEFEICFVSMSLYRSHFVILKHTPCVKAQYHKYYSARLLTTVLQG